MDKDNSTANQQPLDASKDGIPNKSTASAATAKPAMKGAPTTTTKGAVTTVIKEAPTAVIKGTPTKAFKDTPTTTTKSTQTTGSLASSRSSTKRGAPDEPPITDTTADTEPREAKRSKTSAASYSNGSWQVIGGLTFPLPPPPKDQSSSKGEPSTSAPIKPGGPPRFADANSYMPRLFDVYDSDDAPAPPTKSAKGGAQE